MLFSDEDAAVAMFISSPGDEGKVRNNYAHSAFEARQEQLMNFGKGGLTQTLDVTVRAPFISC